METMPFLPEHRVSVVSAENSSTVGLWDWLFFKCLLPSCENVPARGDQGEGGREGGRGKREWGAG